MSNVAAFKEAIKKHLKTLKQYVPVVARVHGGTHPEFYEVQKLFDEMTLKIKEAGKNQPDLNGEFLLLRDITKDYTVPGDVCESYEAVYHMLAELDQAYHA